MKEEAAGHGAGASGECSILAVSHAEIAQACLRAANVAQDGDARALLEAAAFFSAREENKETERARLRAIFRRLQTEERREIARAGGFALWRNGDRERLRNGLRRGQAKVSEEVKRKRAQAGSRAQKKKHGGDAFKEWGSKGAARKLERDKEQ